MNFTYKIEKFSKKENKIQIDQNGRVYGILITHQIQIGEQLVDNGFQEAFVFSTPVIDLLKINGVNIFKRFIKNNGDLLFSETPFSENSMPKFQGKPFIVDERVLVSNNFICDPQGILVSESIAATRELLDVVDEQGNVVEQIEGDYLLDGDGNYIPKDGYFLMANFQFDNAILPTIILPIINLLMYRLNNRD